jgi:hypothetical protein
MRPDVALAFDRLAAAARREARLFISISSGFRSDAEQACLFAAQPNPQLFLGGVERRWRLRCSVFARGGTPCTRPSGYGDRVTALRR